jgi:predicted transcriptional regulator
MELSLQELKLDLINWLTTLQDKDTIVKLDKVRNSTEKFQDISSEDIEGIKRGIDDAENGRVASREEVRKLYAKWL